MKKPTFLFYNMGGDFLGIQMRIQAEGFRALAFYDRDNHHGKSKTGQGLIEVVNDYWKVLNEFKDNPDDLIILIDDNGKGGMADFLKSKGFPVIGTSLMAEESEHDREKGNKLAEDIGVNVPPTHAFTDFGAGFTFLESLEPATKLFFKADGYELAGSSKTYGARNVEDMKRFMTWVQADQSVHNYVVEKFELQEMIEGIEVDMAQWYNGKEFPDTQIVCFEQKKIDGLGAAQGCMGQVITFIPKTKPYSDYFKRLEQKIVGTGPNEWAINAIISDKDHEPYFLEWTPRMGWDATFGELALLLDAGIPLSQFYIRLAYGKSFPESWFPVGRYSAAVRLFSESTGTKPEDTKGKPLWINSSIEKNIWFYGVKKEEDQLVLTDTCFAVATACGDTPDEAIAAVYAMIDPKSGLLTTPDIFYSRNIGDGVPEAIRTLQDYGIMDEY